MNRTQNEFSIGRATFIMCFLSALLILVQPTDFYAATRVEPEGYIKFANMGVDKLSGEPGYLKLNMDSYGINMTTNGGLAQVPGNNKYDVITTSSSSRITYQRRFEVSYGMELCLAGGVVDTGIDGADTIVETIAWNVMEWDANGYVLSDSGWLYTNQTYVVGQSPDKTDWSTSDYWGPMDLKKVKYVTLIVRRLLKEDSMNPGSGMHNNDITAAELSSIFPNIYLCYSPFSYTVKNPSGTILQTLNRLGTESVSISTYYPPDIIGYTAGFKISSSSLLTPNWMNGNIYSPNQVDKWLSNGRFYNSLFGNVTFTQAYVPHTYTISYNANGGTGTMEDTSATYDVSVDLRENTFERTGYTFKGWTTTSDGIVVYDDKTTVKNLTATNGGIVNLYAVWEISFYDVHYDYWTNGGTDASLYHSDVSYGSNIDLSVTATKNNGYTFVGWNTNPSATEGMKVLIMGTEPVTLYAIYKKTIEVTFTESTDAGTVTRKLSETIYNNTVFANFIVTEQGNLSGWNKKGWTNQRDAKANPIIATGETFTTQDSITLYAVYASFVTVSYDANGAKIEYASETKERFHNASGSFSYPTFDIQKAPDRQAYSFVIWEAEDGKTYNDKVSAEIKETTHLTAKWDKHPVIEAYDRYFTLKDAISGSITQEELLSKVIVTDHEDGTLQNGTDVVVKDYHAETFTRLTSDADIEIIYQATDSFGTVITKQIMVKVIDTIMKEGSKKYVRFISRNFFADENGELLSEAEGGLEENSIWRINESYRKVLQETLYNKKANVETWVLTKKELEEMKTYTETHGSVLHAVREFFDLFNKCRKENEKSYR